MGPGILPERRGQKMIKKISELGAEDMARICDHTYLNRSEAFREKAGKNESPVELRRVSFLKFLEETMHSKILPYALCVRPEDVGFTRDYLDIIGSRGDVHIASVVGFPDGSWYSTEFKLAETKLALNEGAEEIDFVLDYRAMRRGEVGHIEKEIYAINREAHDYKALTKMILETSELNNKLIKQACEIAEKCGIDFVKTSTGFSSGGATTKHLKIMRDNFSRGVKMSGGVNSKNVRDLLYAASGRRDGSIDIDPLKIRIGESSLLKQLLDEKI
jgi:deoxyribose-phosphate aldolase